MKKDNIKLRFDILILIISLIHVALIFTIILAIIKRTENHKNYNIAIEQLNSEQYGAALETLDKLGNYKDTIELKQIANNGIIYLKALNLYNSKNYFDAIELFTQIKHFKDSKNKIIDAKYRLAIEYYNNENYDVARTMFSEIYDYQDSSLYLSEINIKTLESSKQIIYDKACSKFESGDYENALKAFETVADFQNSNEKIEECIAQIRRRNLNNVLSAGIRNSAAITNDGHVKVIGDNDYNQCEVTDWENIVSIDVYGTLSIGLKNDGTVAVSGRYDENKIVNVAGWNNIIDVAAGQQFVAGLKSDGTVLIAGINPNYPLHVEDWKDIIAIDAGWDFLVGLTKDHTLVFTGNCKDQQQQFEAEQNNWKEVINISAGGGSDNIEGKRRSKGFTVGLKSDGTVVAIGDNNENFNQCNEVLEWKDVIKVVAGDWYTVGLLKSGGILITGKNIPGTRYLDDYDKNTLKNFNNIKDIAAGFGQTLCLKNDGSILAFGFDDDNKYSGALNWDNLLIP